MLFKANEPTTSTVSRVNIARLYFRGQWTRERCFIATFLNAKEQHLL